jgi:hypothetical protein
MQQLPWSTIFPLYGGASTATLRSEFPTGRVFDDLATAQEEFDPREPNPSRSSVRMSPSPRAEAPESGACSCSIAWRWWGSCFR